MTISKEFDSLEGYWEILEAERVREAEQESERCARLAEFEAGKSMTFMLKTYGEK